ncbi:hypothetical protein PYW08_010458 [Mythimna loreyi]|uniref:Uncharacterized protein n=1 Tax=Mythimna loreyi TaxID=667449 RepID=A0ACC2Q4V2_9NEOP|nr:hypothetical protein PYW08_010458 [Mythimna loreyi]
MYPNNQVRNHNHQKNIVCVNCGIRIQKQRKWMAEESEELKQLLADWVCKELEDNEALCVPCYSLLHSALECENQSRRFGHKNVCLSCGMALNRTRLSKSLEAYPELKLVIAQWVPSHQVKRLELVCLKCIQKAKRLLAENNSGVNCTVQTSTKYKSEDIEVKIEQLGYDELDIPASPYSQVPSEDEDIPEKHPKHLSISLGTYKRAADTSSRCIFKKCTNSERLAIPSTIRERLLLDYSFYLPPNSRICKQHQNSNHEEWRKMVESCTFTDFSEAHLQNLFSIIKNIKCSSYCKNFECQIKKDEILCQYFFGLTFDKYEEMLKDLQPIKKHVRKKALDIYLMKKHTGFSVEKVANFFGTREKWVVKIIDRVQEFFETSRD